MPQQQLTLPRPPGADAPPDAAPLPARPAIAWPADWFAQQFAVAGESTAVLFRGLESMRSIQTQAMQESWQRHAAAAGRLHGTGGEALAARAALVRQDMESATRCWQQLANTAVETNAELWGSALHLVKTEDAFGLATRLFHA